MHIQTLAVSSQFLEVLLTIVYAALYLLEHNLVQAPIDKGNSVHSRNKQRIGG